MAGKHHVNLNLDLTNLTGTGTAPKRPRQDVTSDGASNASTTFSPARLPPDTQSPPTLLPATVGKAEHEKTFNARSSSRFHGISARCPRTEGRDVSLVRRSPRLDIRDRSTQTTENLRPSLQRDTDNGNESRARPELSLRRAFSRPELIGPLLKDQNGIVQLSWPPRISHLVARCQVHAAKNRSFINLLCRDREGTQAESILRRAFLIQGKAQRDPPPLKPVLRDLRAVCRDARDKRR